MERSLQTRRVRAFRPRWFSNEPSAKEEQTQEQHDEAVERYIRLVKQGWVLVEGQRRPREEEGGEK